MSKNTNIETKPARSFLTSELVWILQRPQHVRYDDAHAESVRRCTLPVGQIKAKNVAALEAALVAVALGKSVPHRSTTIKALRTVSVPAVSVPVEAWGFAWDEHDMLVEA